MKKILFLLTAVFMMTTMAAGCGGAEKKAEKPDAKPAVKTETATKKAEAASSHGGKKILVAYFSRTGEEYNVGVITKGNTAVVARPEIVGKPENLKDYDTVFLGYPIWWSDLPMAVYTFLESNDFNGKTIIPFCTSAGSYMTGKESRIADHAKGAKVLNKGLGLPGRMSQEDPKAVKNEVEKWLKDIGY